MEKGHIAAPLAIGIVIGMVFAAAAIIAATFFLPQFTGASIEAKESALRTDLLTVRAQLELYKVQHIGSYPRAATFVTDLTTKVGDYGPYLQTFPTNPFNEKGDVKAEAGTAGLGDATTGWHFDTTTGRFSPNDSPAHAAW